MLAKGSKTFAFAGRFLPPDRLDEAALLYAFCRHADDVADDAPTIEQGRAGLNQLSNELWGRTGPSAQMAAVRELLQRRSIDPRVAQALLDGVGSDLGTVRIASDAALVRYGYQVASTVGLMMCGVLGVDDPEAQPFAVDLGVAMQITNICRDVAEDAANGRVYLPAERLAALGVTSDPQAVLGAREAVRVVVRDLLELADRYYRSAEHGMRFIPWRARLAILVASRVYRAIGVRLARHGHDALAGRTVVPMGGKLVAALGALVAFVGAPWRTAAHVPALHGPIAGWPGADPAAHRVD